MMTLFHRLLAAALLLAVSSSAFQTGLCQRRNLLASSSPSVGWATRSFATKASSDDNEKEEVTDLDKATFQIAKEYDAKGGVPASSEKKIDALSIFLGLYVVFVIVDTIFHITPEENYSTALVNGIKGLIDK